MRTVAWGRKTESQFTHNIYNFFYSFPSTLEYSVQITYMGLLHHYFDYWLGLRLVPYKLNEKLNWGKDAR